MTTEPQSRDPFLQRPDGFRGEFRSDALARSLYAEGAGIARHMPVAVAVPADVESVSLLVRWARSLGHTLVPRGSGSGMAAGAVGHGVIVDLSRFRGIGAIDTAARRVRVGCGALRADVDAAARAVGLRFPVDPSSGAFCTIGGMAATNAAGARSLRFGAMRAWVHGLHCVFDDGTTGWVRRGAAPESPSTAYSAFPWRASSATAPTTLTRLRSSLHHLQAAVGLAAERSASNESKGSDGSNDRTDSGRAGNPLDRLRHRDVRKDSSGYGLADALAPEGSLIDLLVGSEGTLALFTEIELRLIPIARATSTVLAVFASIDAASACAALLRDADPSTTACELLDRTYLDVAAASAPTGIAAGSDAVLLLEAEGEDAPSAIANGDRVAALCRANGAMDVTRATGAEAERRLWTLRHAASPTLARLAPRLRSMQFIEDGCVPPNHFPDYVRGVRAALAKWDTTGVIFGHAGDAHAHVNPLLDLSHAAWHERVRGLFGDVCDLTARLGGTLAGEHGDGRLRAGALDAVWSVEARAAFANVKAAADPAGVLNAGCKIAGDGSTTSAHATARGDGGATDPFASIRYDADLPPIDPRARQALDLMERSRRWGELKLALVKRGGQRDVE